MILRICVYAILIQIDIEVWLVIQGNTAAGIW